MSQPKTIKDLPIYSDSIDAQNKSIWVTIDRNEKSELEKFISTTRQNVCDLMKQFQHQKDASIQYYEESKDKLIKNVDYIRSETNVLPKIAFISLSGLSGLLIGYKKSAFRKFLYTSLLTTGSAALCYPAEAKIYSNELIQLGEKNAMCIYRKYIWPEETNKKGKKFDTPKSNQIDSKDTVVRLDNETIKSSKATKNIVGDKGQSSDEDKDMYTTRK